MPTCDRCDDQLTPNGDHLDDHAAQSCATLPDHDGTSADPRACWDDHDYDLARAGLN